MYEKFDLIDQPVSAKYLFDVTILLKTIFLIEGNGSCQELFSV